MLNHLGGSLPTIHATGNRMWPVQSAPEESKDAPFITHLAKNLDYMPKGLALLVRLLEELKEK